MVLVHFAIKEADHSFLVANRDDFLAAVFRGCLLGCGKVSKSSPVFYTFLAGSPFVYASANGGAQDRWSICDGIRATSTSLLETNVSSHGFKDTVEEIPGLALRPAITVELDRQADLDSDAFSGRDRDGASTRSS